MAARRPEAGEHVAEADGNGFVSGYRENGQRVYRPFVGRMHS
jgi:hypothetical protein